MCGIFGLVVREKSGVTESQLQKIIDTLYALSESRGREASGLAVASSNRIAVLKRNIGGKSLSQLERVREMLVEALTGTGSLLVVAHTRMVTNGAAQVVGNNQPVVRGPLACIHNGIITNSEEVWRGETGLQREHEVDTELLVALLDRELAHGVPLVGALKKAMARLVGANTFALLHDSFDGILLATTNGSLYDASSEQNGWAVFASERYILEEAIKATPLELYLGNNKIDQVKAGNGVLLCADLSVRRDFSLQDAHWPEVAQIEPRRIVDCGSSSDIVAPRIPVANTRRLSEIEREARIDFDAISKLRRCSKCLLPETFPFLRFDDMGVCSLCLQHRSRPKPGKDALIAELAVGGTSLTRCLAPVSGGRDSCFGLHYMVQELGLKPVAYTYDWGLVTDLARRNISRMCGALKLEHVLVSADISRKRDFVRMNVAAWLRRPNLGTVPLFMAGDKQFFYYAEKLRRQMRLDTILFSMNPLERTDFKVGFCGIDEGYDKERHYDPSYSNKLRLAAFYAREFLLNPAFLNASLIDTVGAFVSYYLLPKGYKSLFDYIPWCEVEVERTLLDEYDWEIATDSKSTWRIGDGTAAFYNYIYLRVAGFTEHDTFRSNQIREGLIDREWALSRINEENAPRIESCATYFDTIGLDAVAALRRVNAMPRLY